MANLLMITGDRALAAGKRGAFFNTLEELHKHFDRIDIICPNPGIHRYDAHIWSNVFLHPSPLPLALQWLWIWYQGRRIVREHHPILATVHEYPPFYNGCGAWLLNRATGLPYMLEILHVPGVPRAANVLEWLYRWLSRTGIALDARRAVAVRVMNEHQVPDFLIGAGVPRDKLVYVPAIYLDLDVFKPQDTPKRYDLIFVARRSANKGFDLFQQVVRRTGLKALVIGEGHRFVKDAAEVAGLMNESRLLLMTSYNEGGPRVVLEAMACGVPVVATPVGIVPDVLPPECIEEWDATALADKVKNILKDETLYARLREQGIATAAKFERKTAITAYADAIKKVAGA
jgi:glycosyltransferase involved in cell wall biosynthesis